MELKQIKVFLFEKERAYLYQWFEVDIETFFIFTTG